MPVSTAAASLRPRSLRSLQPFQRILCPFRRHRVVGGLRRRSSPPRRELAPAARRLQRRRRLHGAGRSEASCAPSALCRAPFGPTQARCALGMRLSAAFGWHCASRTGVLCRTWGSARSTRARLQRGRSRFGVVPGAEHSVARRGAARQLPLLAACVRRGLRAPRALHGGPSS